MHKTRTLGKYFQREREREEFELNFEMKFLSVKIFSQRYVSVY